MKLLNLFEAVKPKSPEEMAASYIYRKWYIFDEPKRCTVIIEESKAKYTIDYCDGRISVRAHPDSGATSQRARQIKQDIDAAVKKHVVKQGQFNKNKGGE